MEEELMSLEERKAILAKMARTQVYSRQFHASNRIEAIDTYNKMDGIYKQSIELTKEVVHTFVFKLPDGTRFTPGLPIIEGEAKELT